MMDLKKALVMGLFSITFIAPSNLFSMEPDNRHQEAPRVVTRAAYWVFNDADQNEMYLCRKATTTQVIFYTFDGEEIERECCHVMDTSLHAADKMLDPHVPKPQPCRCALKYDYGYVSGCETLGSGWDIFFYDKNGNKIASYPCEIHNSCFSDQQFVVTTKFFKINDEVHSEMYVFDVLNPSSNEYFPLDVSKIEKVEGLEFVGNCIIL